MTDLSSIGKALILFGCISVLFGIVLTFGGKLSWLGRLPGDIYIQKKGVSFYFPIATSILFSVIISVILMLVRKR